MGHPGRLYFRRDPGRIPGLRFNGRVLIMRSLTLNYYQDPGHGWVRVSVGLLHGLKIAHLITPYSYRRGDHAYLEEDGDLSQLLTAAAAAGITVKLKQHHTNKRSKIRSYDSYRTPARAAAAEAANVTTCAGWRRVSSQY